MEKNYNRPLAIKGTEEGKIVGLKRRLRYTLLFDRINDCIKNAYPIEAIALEESFMSDRLDSFIMFKHKMNKTGDSFGKKIKKVENDIDAEIYKKLKTWKDNRNKIIHEFAKIKDDGNSEWDILMAQSMQIAKSGKELCHKMDVHLRKKGKEK